MGTVHLLISRGDGYRGVRRYLPASLLAAFAVFGLCAAASAAHVLHDRSGHVFGISLRHGAPARLQDPATSVDALGLPRLASPSGDLGYHGGPVLHASAPYLILWLPSGYSLPAGAQSLMSRYFGDVAADSGRSTNVFGVDRQYYDANGSADYAQTFSDAQILLDTTPYPATDTKNCPHVNATYFPICLTDSQLQTEIANVKIGRAHV